MRFRSGAVVHEVVTGGALHALKGVGSHAFYRWLVIVRMATKVFALFVCMLAFGCTLGDSVIGSGKKASETRKVDSFTQLELLGVGRIEVTIGNRQPLELSGDDNILPLIETKVTDGKLVSTLKRRNK
jgi:hypothetical protein